ncbi:MAG: rhodanese-like domain-containing protein [Alphaproteobacteria bacterium]
MSNYIDAPTLKTWLSEDQEIALLDVRELGQYGLSHPFFAIPLAYSGFELRLGALVPNQSTRIAVYDDGTGVAEKAAARAEAMGYGNVHVLEGGTPAWEKAGYTLFSGVNVPSKTFGELVEHELGTPRIPAEELKAMQDASEDFVLVDGRPFAEYTRFNIPGGICCPNGELSLRIKQLAPDPKTKIVVNCAGRTRSIIGAQTLIDLGVPNEVVALENGTQGWLISGLELEYGASRLYPDLPGDAEMSVPRERARKVAEARGVQYVDAGQLKSWLGEQDRTTYVFDVRTQEEFNADGAPGSVHAPGGQLVQATDQWVGVRNVRIVVADDDGVRAGMVASWLRQLGHEAYVFESGVAGLAGMGLPKLASGPELAALKSISAADAKALADNGSAQLIDIRGSMTYREGHINGALWSIRPRITAAVQGNLPVLLVADDPGIAALAASELREAGVDVSGHLSGDVTDWKAAGFEIIETPNEPADDDCIDYLFLTPERNQGNLDDARAYLAWEVGLIDQLDEQERGVFAISPAP